MKKAVAAMALLVLVVGATASTTATNEAQYHGRRSWQDYGGGRLWQWGRRLMGTTQWGGGGGGGNIWQNPGPGNIWQNPGGGNIWQNPGWNGGRKLLATKSHRIWQYNNWGSYGRWGNGPAYWPTKK